MKHAYSCSSNPIALYSNEIKARVPLQEAVSRYLPGVVMRGGRVICCPFHDEKTPSMRLFDDHFHCFGCGAHGDVIDLVSRVMGVRPLDALNQVNMDFALNLPISERPKLSQIARARRQGKDAELAMRREREGRMARLEAYWDALDELSRLEANRAEHAPREMGEAWHPLFVEALSKLSYQKYLVGELWMEI